MQCHMPAKGHGYVPGTQNITHRHFSPENTLSAMAPSCGLLQYLPAFIIQLLVIKHPWLTFHYIKMVLHTVSCHLYLHHLSDLVHYISHIQAKRPLCILTIFTQSLVHSFPQSM